MLSPDEPVTHDVHSRTGTNLVHGTMATAAMANGVVAICQAGRVRVCANGWMGGLFAHRFDAESSLAATASLQSGYLPSPECDTQLVFLASQTIEKQKMIPNARTRIAVLSFCYLIILPLLSTLVNHTKTILVQNLVFCMISRDSGMQCADFVISLVCEILNRFWLRNYIGLHSSVSTPLESLPPQLISHEPRTTDTNSQETPHAPVSHFSNAKKKHLIFFSPRCWAHFFV